MVIEDLSTIFLEKSVKFLVEKVLSFAFSLAFSNEAIATSLAYFKDASFLIQLIFKNAFSIGKFLTAFSKSSLKLSCPKSFEISFFIIIF